MPSSTQPTPPTAGKLWTGRVFSTLVVLLLLFDSLTKILKVPAVLKASAPLGYSPNVIAGIGMTLLVCILLYVIPRASVLGALLLTAYLGGAVDANLHAGSAFGLMMFPVLVGILAWAGLYLREPRLSALIPWRR